MTSIGFFFFSCSRHAGNNNARSERIVVSGKVLNFIRNNLQVNLSINRISFKQESIFADIDSAGNFKAVFESYIPTDIWVIYKTNFLVLVHPKDSLHVVFDGGPSERPGILKTISFGGTSAKLNMEVSKYQYLYFTNDIYTNWDKKRKAEKEYDEEQYLAYLDTIRHKAYEIRDNFVSAFSPSHEAIDWVNNNIEFDYYYNLAYYPMLHKKANLMADSLWDVSSDYYDHFLKRLPINPTMYICGNGLESFVNSFHAFYADKHARSEKRDSVIADSPTSGDPADTLFLFKLLKYVPDTLLKQMILAEDLNWQIDCSEDISLYEANQSKIENIIHQPFLIEPLKIKYREAKMRLENPKIASDAILNKISATSAKQIMDSILIRNKGKVIYLAMALS
jgi:hypothetical protein